MRKYEFTIDFDIRSVNYASFVSALNFPKIIETKTEQKEFRYYVDGTLMKMIYFLKYGVLVKKFHFDLSGIASIVLEYIGSNSDIDSVLWCGGNENDINVFSEYVSVNWPSVHSKSNYTHGFKSNEDIVNLGKGFSCVILGLGSPKQELVGEKLAGLMVPRVYTCGAFISQTAKQNGTEYYPVVFKFLNVRWLYRALREKGHYKRLTYALSKSVTSFKYLK